MSGKTITVAVAVLGTGPVADMIMDALKNKNVRVVPRKPLTAGIKRNIEVVMIVNWGPAFKSTEPFVGEDNVLTGIATLPTIPARPEPRPLAPRPTQSGATKGHSRRKPKYK